MKADIHPTYYATAKVVCACGNTFTVGATKPEIHTEICAACHPFYTGEQRIVDTAGQVERFMRRLVAGDSQRSAEQVKRDERREADRQAMLQRRGLTPLAARRPAKVKAIADATEEIPPPARERR